VNDALPPHDLAAERNTIACVLDSDESNAAQRFSQLEERYFYGEQSLEIFRALTKCEADGKPLNIVSLGEQLLADRQPANLDFAQTLTVPSAAAFPSYLEILNDRAARRDQVSQAQRQIQRARDMSLPFTAVADNSKLLARLEARLYSPQSKPQEPTPRFSLAEIPICTPGNLTTISAQAKAGKTAAIGAMIASTFSKPDADCLGFTSQNPNGFAVIKIDSEQSEFDHWDGVQRIIHRAQVDVAPPWLLSYFLTGFSAGDVRAAIPCLLEQAKKRCKGIHSVFIDGTADAANDVNDPAESNGLVTELHALAIQFACPIINVIHVNPGSDFKTRGHLGSQLERKSETNLRLEKDESGATVIYADKNRRAPITKATAPRFMWSDEAGMHVTIASQRSAKADAEKQEMQIEAEAVFAAAKREVISYGQIIGFLQSEVHASKSTAKRRLAQMIQTQILKKELTGFYALNS
jgi:hypothetical protein